MILIKTIPLRIPTKSLITFKTTECCTYRTFWGPPTFLCTVQAYNKCAAVHKNMVFKRANRRAR